MNSLKLYKFIQDNNIEYRWEFNVGCRDVIIFVMLYQLEEFSELIGPGIVDDEGLDIVLKSNYVAIWMDSVCDYYDIEMEEVFGNDPLE